VNLNSSAATFTFPKNAPVLVYSLAAPLCHLDAAMPKKTETTFSVVFKKGMALKNRLPLSHVISTLRELDYMIREVGRKVQQENGRQEPDGDFGIELLAGATGLAFHKGSLFCCRMISQ
jgi:hypothetical protein